VSILFTLIQNCLGIPSQSNKIGRRNQRNSNRKGRQTIHICSSHDHIPKRPGKLQQKISSKIAGYKSIYENHKYQQLTD
jgi:hypothetical protein